MATDDDTSRASLTSSMSRNTEEHYRSEHQRIETELHDAQTELYQLRRILPFLHETNPHRPSETFRTIATECADLRDERDQLKEELEQLKEQHRQELETKDDAIEKLKRLLLESQDQCNNYKRKCQEYEKEQSEDESAYYRREMNTVSNRQALVTPKSHTRPRKAPPPTADAHNRPPLGSETTLNRTLNSHYRNIIEGAAANDEHLHDLYTRMDGDDSESSIVSRASARPTRDAHKKVRVNYEANYTITDPLAPDQVAPHVADYMEMLRQYRSNIRDLYGQLKSTSNFFVKILDRIGCGNDTQIQLLLEKISHINLNIQDSDDLYHRVEQHSRRLENDLAAMHRSNQAMRATPDESRDAAAHHKTHISQDKDEFEAMLKHKDDLIAELTLAKNELDIQKQKLQADLNELLKVVSQLEDRCNGFDQERDLCMTELKNRENIIDALTIQLQAEVNGKETQVNELKQRLHIIAKKSSSMNKRLEAKIRDGAAKCGYVIREDFRM